ncbi:DUF748 domain-containing protein [Marinomonas sp. 2405UD68-3]|uniref:DUF748 domain-containing protein n=1 Tax=Marinomonas sp. 2405UD68-3 TaxID=3391835 RepID=UPI0039C9F09F
MMIKQGLALSKLRHLLVLILSVLFVLGLIIWMLLPVVTKTLLNNYFQQHNAQLIIKDLDINPFKGIVKANDITAYSYNTNKKEQVLSLKSAEFSVSYGFLFAHTIYVDTLNINGLYTNLKESKDSWYVAGLTFPITPTDTSPNTSTDSHVENTPNQSKTSQTESNTDANQNAQWKIDIPHILFSDIHFSITRFNKESPEVPLTDTFDINHITLSNIEGNNNVWQGMVDMDMSINQSTVQLHSQLHSSPEKVMASVKVNQFSVDSAQFSHYFSDTMPTPQVSLVASGDISIEKHLKTPSADLILISDALSIQLDDINIQTSDINVTSAGVSLDTNNLMVNVSDNSNEQDITARANANLQFKATTFSMSENEQSNDTPAMNVSIQDLTAGSNVEIHKNNQLLSVSSDQSHTRVLELAGEMHGTTLKNRSSQLKLTNIMFKQSLKNEITLSGSASFDSDEFSASSAMIPYSMAYQKVQFESQINLNKDLHKLNLNAKNTNALINESTFIQAPLHYENETTELVLPTLDIAWLLNGQNDVSINTETRLNSHKTYLKNAADHAQYEDLTLTGNLSVNKEEDKINAQSDNIIFVIKRLLGSQSGYTLGSELLTLILPSTSLELSPDQQLSITSNPSIDLERVDVSDTQNNKLIGFDALSITPIQIEKKPDSLFAKLDRVTATNLVVSSPSQVNEQIPPLAVLGKIHLDSLAVSNTQAKIHSVFLADLESTILLDEERNLKNNVFVQNDETTTQLETKTPSSASYVESSKNESTEPSSNPKAPFHLILDQFKIMGDSKIHLNDKGVFPSLDQTIFIDTFNIAQIDTRNPEQKTQIVLDARNGKYATINVVSDLVPLSEKLTMNTKFSTKEIELTPFSPYVSDLLGYTIESGQLDADISLNANQGKLKGQSNLLLRRFDLAGNNGQTSKSPSTIPLNLAIGALKDSQDNIALDIPMSGNIDNPKFQWENFLIIPIRKALYSASSSYVMQTLVPYANVISIVQIAGEQLLKLRVEPLLYEPEQIELSPSQQMFTQELAALLTEKDDVQLKMCSIAIPSDIGIQDTSIDLNEEQTQSLKTLAKHRADILKEHLVAEGGISSSRILLCAPALDRSNKTLPRIEFEF